MIQVIASHEQAIDVPNATAWHVDEAAGLHLSNADKAPVASFAPTKWIGVLVRD